MRKDIGKILTETYRVKFDDYKGKFPRVSKKVNETLYEYGGKISMRKPHALSGNRKDFGENLSPLRRFLETSVGRKWDDVYSEIKASVPNNGTIQNHLYQHLFDFVDFPRKVSKKLNNVGKLKGWGIQRGRRYSGSYNYLQGGWHNLIRLFVHPDTGILCKAPEGETYRQYLRQTRAKTRKELESKFIRKDGYDLFREGSLWFRADWDYEVSELVLVKPNYLNHFHQRNWDFYSDEEKIEAGGYRLRIYKHSPEFSSHISRRVLSALESRPKEAEMKDKDGAKLVYTKVHQLSKKEIKRLGLPLS